jgi:Zn-dependent protease
MWGLRAVPLPRMGKQIMNNSGENSLNNTIFSFVLMLVIWAMLFGSWQFALAFLVLLGIHEMGHFVVARALGMNVSMPIFTPIGALIQMRETPRNAFEEALMAYGGPFIGTIGAVGALVLGHTLDSDLLILAAKAGFFLNLFNLIPLSPLDGGRISMAISRWLWLLGVPLLLGLFYLQGFSILSAIILFLIGRWAYQDVLFRNMQAVQTPEYFAIGAARRVGVIVAYLGLIAFLMFALNIA